MAAAPLPLLRGATSQQRCRGKTGSWLLCELDFDRESQYNALSTQAYQKLLIFGKNKRENNRNLSDKYTRTRTCSRTEENRHGIANGCLAVAMWCNWQRLHACEYCSHCNIERTKTRISTITKGVAQDKQPSGTNPIQKLCVG